MKSLSVKQICYPVYNEPIPTHPGEVFQALVLVEISRNQTQQHKFRQLICKLKSHVLHLSNIQGMPTKYIIISLTNHDTPSHFGYFLGPSAQAWHCTEVLHELLCLFRVEFPSCFYPYMITSPENHLNNSHLVDYPRKK